METPGMREGWEPGKPLLRASPPGSASVRRSATARLRDDPNRLLRSLRGTMLLAPEGVSGCLFRGGCAGDVDRKRARSGHLVAPQPVGRRRRRAVGGGRERQRGNWRGDDLLAPQ